MPTSSQVRVGRVKGPAALLQSAAVTDHARAVIIGGGVGGASIAYHLTAKGWRDVVVVERAELTSGSTFHSAGLVGQLRSSVALTRLMMWSVECYRRLAAETGRDPGWKETGSLRLACTPERDLEHRRQTGWAKTFGLPLEEIGPAEAQRLFPAMALDGVLGAVYLPTDGHLDPSGLAMALAEGARQRGAAIRTGTRVLGIAVRDGRVREVETTAGSIRTEVVVNAGGMYAPEIGRMVGVTIPSCPWPISTSSPSRSTGCTLPSRCSGTRTISSTSGRRSAGWWPAGTSARRRPGGSMASRRTSTTSFCRRTGSALPL